MGKATKLNRMQMPTPRFGRLQAGFLHLCSGRAVSTVPHHWPGYHYSICKVLFSSVPRRCNATVPQGNSAFKLKSVADFTNVGIGISTYGMALPFAHCSYQFSGRQSYPADPSLRPAGSPYRLASGAQLRGKFRMSFSKTTPILRIFDERKAKEFFVGFLGYRIDWEHRFEEDAPLYMQVSKDDCILHLSEHHGDCSPGAAVRIACRDLDAYCKELLGKGYRYCRPKVDKMPYGTRDMFIQDPFGNRLIFTNAVCTDPQ